jgi:hypothetical protein
MKQTPISHMTTEQNEKVVPGLEPGLLEVKYTSKSSVITTTLYNRENFQAAGWTTPLAMLYLKGS